MTASGVRKDEEKKPNIAQSTHINIKVKRQNGNELNEVSVRIKRSAQLKKLINDYCDAQSVEKNEFVFLFEGRKIKAERTPDELEMEEGAEIDAMIHQTGGGI